MKFVENHDDKIYDVEAAVKKAVDSKLVGYTKGKDTFKKDTITWGYKKGNKIIEDGEIHTYRGTGAKQKDLVAFLLENEEAYNTLMIKLEERAN
jgi:bifunctional pyridoxal-dependent enzyme with beta-cystathionase and maltose regulon repressor activities